MTYIVVLPWVLQHLQLQSGRCLVQVWDPEKIVIIPDHYIFTSDARANRNVDILRCSIISLPCLLCSPVHTKMMGFWIVVST